VAHGSTVQLRSTSPTNGWYPVVCAGQNGWMSGDYLTINGGSGDPDPGRGCGLNYTIKAVIYTKNMDATDFREVDNIVAHMDGALYGYTEGCVDVDFISVTRTTIAPQISAEGQPLCNAYSDTMGKDGADIFMMFTDPSVTFSGAAGHQAGNCLWVESGLGYEYIADHELGHWADWRYGVNVDCPNDDGPHCHYYYGYGVDTPAWYDFYFDQVNWP
jgi:hypothetical protein